MFLEINCNGGCPHFINIAHILSVNPSKDEKDHGCLINSLEGPFPTALGQDYAWVTAEIIRITGMKQPTKRAN